MLRAVSSRDLHLPAGAPALFVDGGDGAVDLGEGGLTSLEQGLVAAVPCG
ncbi:MAG: hypothetical protein ABIZ07_00045 [Dermatophilaceae bacterium]